MTGEPVCLYVRVSTLEQAKHDLSIPDQLNQLRAFAEKRGKTVAVEFIEPGATGRNDHRSQFQEMLGRALMKPPEFTQIIVHSLSRFFRDAIEYEVYNRKLEKNGVQIVSITQDFGEGTGSEIARRIVTLTENSKRAVPTFEPGWWTRQGSNL